MLSVTMTKTIIDKQCVGRGNGPPPPGMVTCWDRKCQARRDPHSGRFGRVGNHYHALKIVEVAE